MKAFTKKIVLENGREFYGYGFGADREAINEIVFNTSIVGYQEIMSDPSYTDQMVVMTYPLIGNYGMADEDYETKTPTIGGMIVREYNDLPSNFRYTRTLSEVLEEYGIPGIWGLDTRALTRVIRDEGTQKVIVTDAATPREEALARLEAYDLPHDMVARVSCKKRWMSRVPNHSYDVVAIDCGIKNNIIRQLNRVGCNVTIVPYNATVEEIMAFRPDGIVLSNGPGNPEDVQPVIETVRRLRGRRFPRARAARGAADLRHLHGPPAPGARLRRPHAQDEVRPPRREPPCAVPRNGPHRDHEPEPQLRRRCRLAAGHGARSDARQPARRHGRGDRLQGRPRLFDAVPPRERRRAARQLSSVQEVRTFNGGGKEKCLREPISRK